MLKVCFKTDAGGKRSINEDNLVAKQLGDFYLLAVADGLGGHAAGEVASKIAVTEIEEFLRARLGREALVAAMKGAVSKANSEIYSLSKKNPDYASMATTLVMAIVSGNKAAIANVGDSRAYQIGRDGIKQITRDHSLVNALLEKKVITADEARVHPRRNVMTKSLGVMEEVEADLYEVELDRDFLLLCSDGLHDVLLDMEIEQIVRSASSPEEACRLLIKGAIEAGTRDNVTVVVAKHSP